MPFKPNIPHESLEPEQRTLLVEIEVLERTYDAMTTRLKGMTGPDGRELSLSITHAEDAFMRLRRSVVHGTQNPGRKYQENN